MCLKVMRNVSESGEDSIFARGQAIILLGPRHVILYVNYFYSRPRQAPACLGSFTMRQSDKHDNYDTG